MANLCRIACIGTQNTGKTTFIQDFIKANPGFQTPPESYRDVVKAQNLKINRNGTIAHQWIIFKHLNTMFADYQYPTTIFDRSPFDAYIYTLYIAKGGKGLEDMLESSLKALQTVDAVFWFSLMGNEGIKLKRDRLRDIDPEYRVTIDGLFAEHLDKNAPTLPPICKITGSRQARLVQAKGFLNDTLNISL